MTDIRNQTFLDQEIPLPGAEEVQRDLVAYRDKLKTKNVIVTCRPDEFDLYKDEYTLTKLDLTALTPWKNVDSLDRTGITNDLPRIKVTDLVREQYAEHFASRPSAYRRAVYLFSRHDLAEWLRENTVTQVATVVVPLSMFSSNPDGFRKAFMEEKEERLYPANKAYVRKAQLKDWKTVRDALPPQILSEICQWPGEYAAECVRTNLVFPIPPMHNFSLPEDVILRYSTIYEKTDEMGISCRAHAAKILWLHGMVRHVITRQKKILWTPGLLLGKPENWPDYALGLVDTMSVERAARLFGMSYLESCPWNFGSDDILWQGDGKHYDRYGYVVPFDYRLIMNFPRMRAKKGAAGSAAEEAA